MSTFGGFFARKTNLAVEAAAPAPAATPTPDNPLEVDEELFSALGARLGGENEALRNLLIDANSKISELDAVKDAVGKLVDPVNKALRAFETEKTEKISLQTVLNNTRTAYGKLRNEIGDLEKRASLAESECLVLRQELTTTQNTLRTLEATKAEIAIDIAARRAQIADLEARLAQETGEAKALREDNRRFDERLTAANKREITLEADLNSARQKLILAEDERRSQQTSIDNMLAETARLSRKLAEAETALATTHGRLRHVEANFNEANTERARLATALDAANERFEHEAASQRMRLEAMQTRATATDRLLTEAREHLLARAEEVRESDRRIAEQAATREQLEARVAELENARIKRESELAEIDQARATLLERSGQLARAFTGKEAALGRAEETIASLNARIATLEGELEGTKQAANQHIEDLNAALRREQLERSVVEGALETGRKDFARLMREVMALQRNQAAREPEPQHRAANAA